MKELRIATAVLAVFIAGCTHLQQAPLVYSSKTSMGVDIATTSTETPGIAFNLGYKQVDAAYVPVAVARTCKENESLEQCSGKIELVTGNSHATSEATDVGTGDIAKADRLAKAAGDLQKATQQAQDTALAESVLRREQEALTAQYKPVAAKYPQEAPGGSAAAAGAASEGVATGPSPEEKKILDEYQDKYDDLQAKIQAAARTAQLAQDDLVDKRKLLVSAADEAANVERHDSYSVFGSFSGKADGKASGEAKVGLGKIFATGVASQNISDGLAKAYERQPDAAAACYSAVAAANPNAETLPKLLAACQQQVSN